MKEIMQAAMAIEALKKGVDDARDPGIRFEYEAPFLDALYVNREIELPDDLKKKAAERLGPLFGDSPDSGRLVDFVACQMTVESYRKQFVLDFRQDEWLKGICPFCGNSAGLAYHEEGGTRKLVCGFCWTDWKFPRGICPYCNHESDKYSLFEVDGRDVRLDQCENCGCYLKTSISGMPESFAGFDVKTLFLDEWALGKGMKKPGSSLIGIHFFS